MNVGELLPKNVQKWLQENIYGYPNVIGYSATYKPWIAGKNVYENIPVVRIYVEKKVDFESLKPEELVPPEVKIRNLVTKKAYQTDIVEIGKVVANPPIPEAIAINYIDKTTNWRPVEIGVSCGNEAITAGSLGMLYKGIDGQLYVAGTNAHVATPNAGMSVAEVKESGKINILQRGAYHGGKVPNDVAGIYLWHQQIFGIGENISDCPVARFCAWVLNGISAILGRQSRFKVLADPLTNSIDFALYTPTVEHKLKIADDSIDVTKQFIGHLYAGSETSGIICKISEILKQCPYAITPLNDNYGDPEVGDKVKGCSFWCNYETEVIDINGVINVSYGNFIAIMTNAIIVKNDGTIKGGWSGSGWFKV